MLDNKELYLDTSLLAPITASSQNDNKISYIRLQKIIAYLYDGLVWH